MTDSLIIECSSRSLVVSWHQYDPRSGSGLVCLAGREGISWADIVYCVCEHAVPRAWCACVVVCVRLGQGRPQGEISDVTLVLGRFKMGAAEQEGKEDCGD